MNYSFCHVSFATILIQLMANAFATDVAVDGDQQVMSIEIQNVAPGYRNTEFVYKIVKMTHDAMFITRFVLQLDKSVTHNAIVYSCQYAHPGTYMYP